jgi:hypothetical protein
MQKWCYDNDSEAIDSVDIDSKLKTLTMLTLTVPWHWQCYDIESANFKMVLSADLEYIMIWFWYLLKVYDFYDYKWLLPISIELLKTLNIDYDINVD